MSDLLMVIVWMAVGNTPQKLAKLVLQRPVAKAPGQGLWPIGGVGL